MIHIQYITSARNNKDIFWIKPLWCPIGSPFCIVRWTTKRGMNICPIYRGVRRKIDGTMYVECKYDDVPESKTQSYLVPPYSLPKRYDDVSTLNAATGSPENCPRCMHYIGSICMTYGEFRNPCDNFIDEERFITETAKKLWRD